MLIIIDHKIAPKAKEKLAAFGHLIELRTEGITYPAISGHPDIFLCQAPGQLIVAPNLPEKYLDTLSSNGINFIPGEFPVGAEYPASARYNAIAAGQFLIHNFRHTDFMITRTLEDLHPIHVDQGYTRCNLLPLKDGHFITSDEGIYKVLMRCHLPPEIATRCHLDVLLVSPDGIQLDGFPHGFFGGCCGIWENKVLINGSLDQFPAGVKVRQYMEGLGYGIVELSEGPLVDVGSILFV
jgi:hypothetical protein